MATSQQRPHPSGATGRSRGQALVETALLIPILLILLLGAIDFGRLFFGWVSLHQTARIGANFAATHPGTSTDPDNQENLVALIETDASALNCDPDVGPANPSGEPVAWDDLALAYTKADGTPATTPVLGDFATLSLSCDFSPLIPLSDLLFGDPITMAAISTFPVREGCINCPAPAPVPPPPTPEQCRPVPEMHGMSVAGARLAWESAGFSPAAFTVVDGGEETSTVELPPTQIHQNDPLSECVLPLEAVFFSDAEVFTADPDEEQPGCATVPNLIGMTVADAEAAWAVDFDVALFRPDVNDDARRVVDQTTTPESIAGVSCMDVATQIDLITGDPWPAPPPSSCQVPSMTNSRRNDAAAKWIRTPTANDRSGGFAAGNFSPTSGNFIVKSQSLVGGTWVPCSASITVSASPQ